MLSKEGISAHYYCILFAPDLQQNGSLDEGFKGFLVEDVQKEVRRGSRLFCNYCHKKGAVIGCYVSDCNVKFHLNCGLVNDSFHNFHDPMKNYPSFCCKHRPVQKTGRVNDRKSEEDCLICREAIVRKANPKSLWTPCCSNWLHRECVVKQAYHSGKHFFKCPKCNNKDIFVAEMKKYGVYVPTRDASWEKGQVFEQMFKKEYKCSADKCLSKKGIDYNGDNEWELLACDGCGANAIHPECGGLDAKADEWLCPLCKPVLQRSSKKLKLIQDN